jgi:hypothetical protein
MLFDLLIDIGLSFQREEFGTKMFQYVLHQYYTELQACFSPGKLRQIKATLARTLKMM